MCQHLFSMVSHPSQASDQSGGSAAGSFAYMQRDACMLLRQPAADNSAQQKATNRVHRRTTIAMGSVIRAWWSTYWSVKVSSSANCTWSFAHPICCFVLWHEKHNETTWIWGRWIVSLHGLVSFPYLEQVHKGIQPCGDEEQGRVGGGRWWRHAAHQH